MKKYINLVLDILVIILAIGLTVVICLNSNLIQVSGNYMFIVEGILLGVILDIAVNNMKHSIDEIYIEKKTEVKPTPVVQPTPVKPTTIVKPTAAKTTDETK